jgi:hypothetical protein
VATGLNIAGHCGQQTIQTAQETENDEVEKPKKTVQAALSRASQTKVQEVTSDHAVRSAAPGGCTEGYSREKTSQAVFPGITRFYNQQHRN